MRREEFLLALEKLVSEVQRRPALSDGEVLLAAQEVTLAFEEELERRRLTLLGQRTRFQL